MKMSIVPPHFPSDNYHSTFLIENIWVAQSVKLLPDILTYFEKQLLWLALGRP
jgi:hypothetical protein